MDKIDKYLKIVSWAAARYRKNSKLITWIGPNPSKYTTIEIMAFNKYVKN